MHFAHAKSKSSSNSNDDTCSIEQTITVVLQTLKSLNFSFTPLDIVIEILRATGKHEDVKQSMLEPSSISRLLDALASCIFCQDLPHHNVIVDVVLKRVHLETRSIVTRLGDALQHPLLLGHVEVRSETSDAPLLRAILEQVKTSTTLDEQPPELDTSLDVAEPTLTQETALIVPIEVEVDKCDSQENVNSDTTCAGHSDLTITSTTEVITNDSSRKRSMSIDSGVSYATAADTLPPDDSAYGMRDDYHSMPFGDEDQFSFDFYSLQYPIEPELYLGSEAQSLKSRFTTLSGEEDRDERASTAEALQSFEEQPYVDSEGIPSSILLGEPTPVQLYPSLNDSVASTSFLQSPDYVIPPTGDQTFTPHNDECGLYRCTLCMKSFRRRHGLKDHMNIHTGETPYACPIPGCSSRFTHYGSLNRHRRKHPEYKPRKKYDAYVPERFAGSSSPASITPLNGTTTYSEDMLGTRSPTPSVLQEESSLADESAVFISPRGVVRGRLPPKQPRKPYDISEDPFKRTVLIDLPMSSGSLETIL